MVLLTHTNVMVPTSKSLGLGPLRNLTSINATKTNANENALNFYLMLLCMGLCIKYVRKIFRKSNIFYQESKKY